MPHYPPILSLKHCNSRMNITYLGTRTSNTGMTMLAMQSCQGSGTLSRLSIY